MENQTTDNQQASIVQEVTDAILPVMGNQIPPKRLRKDERKELVWRRPEGKKFDITPSPRVDEQTWAILEKLAPNKRVLLQYSTGKDSIACWLELAERGYTVVPFFKQTFEGLSFIDSVIAAHEAYFGTEVIIVPNRHLLYDRLKYFNSPTDLADMGPDYKDVLMYSAKSSSWQIRYRKAMVDMMLEENNCDICVIGTKASDSLHRRTHFKVDGPYLPSERLFSLLWRMTKNGPFELMIEKKCPIPKFYLWLGRSPEFVLENEFYFIKKYYPEDYYNLCKILKNLDVYVMKYEHNLKAKHVIKPSKIIKEARMNGHPFV